MGETTETIRLRLQADQFAVEIQKQKDHIKNLDNQLKQFELTAKKRNQIIIDKAGAEKNLKELQNQAKDTETALKNTGKGAEISGKSFLKMGLMLTGVAGAGRGAIEFLKKFFKESVVFQSINIAIGKLGKSVSSFIDRSLKPLIKGMTNVRDLEIEKILKDTEKAAIKDAAAFQTLALKVNGLGKVLNPTLQDQQAYSRAIEAIKKQYPEYLGFLSTEIKNHTENNKLIQAQSDLLYKQIAEKMALKETEELIQDRIKAERELNKVMDEKVVLSEELQAIELSPEFQAALKGQSDSALKSIKNTLKNDEVLTKRLRTQTKHNEALKRTTELSDTIITLDEKINKTKQDYLNILNRTSQTETGLAGKAADAKAEADAMA